jgi:hypothetical protein
MNNEKKDVYILHPMSSYEGTVPGTPALFWTTDDTEDPIVSSDPDMEFGPGSFDYWSYLPDRSEMKLAETIER